MLIKLPCLYNEDSGRTVGKQLCPLFKFQTSHGPLSQSWVTGPDAITATLLSQCDICSAIINNQKDVHGVTVQTAITSV